MSLRKNILANYASQIYVTLIGIAMVPLYIKYMGAEAYGLVGFFAMLQAWFNLLDMGLTPTMVRETSRFHGGATDALSYRRLVRALEWIFLIVALVGAAIMLAASGYISHDWLKATKLPMKEVEIAVELMAIIIAMRWMSGLYRGAISGAEKLVWLAGFNATIATLRFGGAFPVLMLIGSTPTIFFGFQFVVATIELGVLILYAYRLLPYVPQSRILSWSWDPLKPVLKFSLNIAFTSVVWVLVTQTDKLVLSKILPLDEYGYFTLAVLAASVVMIISGPISGAIIPRMTKLEAEGNHIGLIHVYRQATQLVAVIAGAASLTVAFCAEPLLLAWTGNQIMASQAAPILALYALGNGILAVAAFPYYLQYAKGDLSLHVFGNALFVVILVPTIIWATTHYGAIGAGYVWFGINLLSFVAWLPLVHRKFEPGLNFKWYGQDILVIILAGSIAGYFANKLFLPTENRWLQIIEIICIGLFIFFACLGASSEIRTRVSLWLSHRRNRLET